MDKTLDSLVPDREIRDDIKGIVFNIQKYSIHDGPGIRTNVFLKGCPLRCLWCSNPESQNAWPEIAHRNSLCNHCGQCVQACQLQAISVDEKGPVIDRERCTDCGRCIEVCSPGALKLFGEEKYAWEIFREVEKDIDFYRNSGGGVTVSGGEPLMQPVFVASLFKQCQDAGINTCLETTGCAGVTALEQVLPYTDLVLFDVKLSGPANHLKWTGKTNERIIRNLARLATSKVPVIIRIPFITGVNNSDEELKSIAGIAVDFLSQTARVNLLPYHKFGSGKYPMLDRTYQMPDSDIPTDGEMQKAQKIIESFGLECQIVK